MTSLESGKKDIRQESAKLDPKKQGVFSRLLEWLSKGNEKAVRQGNFCAG